MNVLNSKSIVTPMTSDQITCHKQRVVQNFLLVWLDTDIDRSKEEYHDTLTQLRSIVNDINIFTEADESIDFLTEIQNERVFLIVTGTLGQQIIPLINDIPQLDAIYIFCENKLEHEQDIKESAKIKDVYTEIRSLCEALELATKQCNQDLVTMNFVPMSEETSSEDLNQLEPSFMYTQIFKEILFKMKYDENSIQALANYCRRFYKENIRELSIIDEFERDYHLKSPIWWYTRECFTYQMLNRALRGLETDTLFSMGFFICNLHNQIEQLHRQQIGDYHGQPFVVCRGQGLSTKDFEKLRQMRGGLLSFNNFLSTSQNQEVSLRFAKRASNKFDTVGIFFQIYIDPSISSAPFASIREVSYYKKEEEVLFSMHTTFRIGEISNIDDDNSLYQVHLDLTSDDDQQLRTLTNRIREELADTKGWKQMGLLLLKLGHFDQAEELYKAVLQRTLDADQKAVCYNNLGYIKNCQGDYEKAIWYHEKSIQIQENTHSPDQAGLATSYNNIGLVYDNLRNYSEALSFYIKSLQIREKILPQHHPDFGQSYSNIGAVCNNARQYSQALLFHQKALEIWHKNLPSNHPDLTASYHNIACVYQNMEEYSEALLFHEKARQILEKTLPSNHIRLAFVYNSIALTYYRMKQYSNALLYLQRALDIVRSSPANHLHLGNLQLGIEIVTRDMNY